MTKLGYACSTEGEVALSAGVAKSVLGAKAGAGVGLDLQYFEIDFDGVTASAEPVLVELCYCTFATNSPGTNSTGGAERQLYGRVTVADWTAGFNWIAEPTVVTSTLPFALDPNKGLFSYDFSLGQTPDTAVAEGFVIRCNAPAAVSCRATLKLEHA
jgi:hypothetical protein